MAENGVILIIYTTKYRLGGGQFPVVADTLAKENRAKGFPGEIVSKAVESKRDVLAAIDEIRRAGNQILEFHFIGHSGMYGPMFGTVAFPEQFSPFEWEQTKIPFSPDASAYFHCCRSARWFAPFFARTFDVKAHGYFWYTTFSRSKNKFVSAGRASNGNIYTIGCKGRKSHGFLASLQKRAGLMRAERIKAFEPQPPDGDSSYDHVADLYDAAFQDIRVRRQEWDWLMRHLPRHPGLRVLDIGCGNGALLNALSPRIEFGIGVDESMNMVEKAITRNADSANLSFKKIEGPNLPFNDASFDIAISMMSFRYLDWDPLIAEIKRVVRPGGLFLIIDMVTVPVAMRESARFLSDKLTTVRDQRENRQFNNALQKLVSHPDWKKMLEYNPIRSEHEMKWYLESRFPGRKVEVLNIGWNARTIAFDSGPVNRAVDAKLSYP